MNTITRRQCLQYAAASALPLAFGVSPAHAADAYPSRPITLTVGFAPGGSGDILARLMGEALYKAGLLSSKVGAAGKAASTGLLGAPSGAAGGLLGSGLFTTLPIAISASQTARQ